MEFLVIEETVGYGACLKTDSYNLWYLELIPLTHHIVAKYKGTGDHNRAENFVPANDH